MRRHALPALPVAWWSHAKLGLPCFLGSAADLRQKTKSSRRSWSKPSRRLSYDFDAAVLFLLRTHRVWGVCFGKRYSSHQIGIMKMGSHGPAVGAILKSIAGRVVLHSVAARECLVKAEELATSCSDLKAPSTMGEDNVLSAFSFLPFVASEPLSAQTTLQMKQKGIRHMSVWVSGMVTRQYRAFTLHYLCADRHPDLAAYENSFTLDNINEASKSHL